MSITETTAPSVQTDPFTSAAARLTGPFVGRRAELELLARELDEARRGHLRVFMIEGPAGIGKTTLVDRFLEQHPDLQSLHAGADEWTSFVCWSVVDQLLRLADNAEPLEPPELPGDHATAGGRLLEQLAALEARGVLAVVVDDAHWADDPSLQALLFSIRRLRTERIIAVFVARDDEAHRIPESLRRMAMGASGATLRLEGLDADDLQALGGELLSRRAALELHAHTLGNPLHASALLRELPPEAWTDPERSLPAPRALGAQVASTAAACASGVRALVEAAAVLGMVSPLHVVAELAGVADPLLAFEQACDARLLAREDRHGIRGVRFRDPLIRAAVYDQIGPARQASLHLAAAALATEPALVLRHRFAAAQGPDAGLASQLDGIGEGAARRGRWADAASSLLSAARASAEPILGQQRLLRAVECMLHGGDVARARTFADEIAALARGPLRDALLGHMTLAERPADAERLLRGAWESCDPAAEPSLAATVALDNAVEALVGLRGHDAVIWSARAIEAAEPADPACALARGTHALGLAHLGRVAEGVSVLDAELALLAPDAGDNGMPLRVFRGWLRLVEEDLDGARADLGEAAASALRVGSFDMGVLGLCQLARVEYAAGAWDRSIASARHARSVADRLEGLWVAPFALWAGIAVPAARGDWPVVAELVRAADAAPAATEVQVIVAALTRAHAAGAHGEHETVIAELAPLIDPATSRAVDVPGLWPWADLYADALVSLDRVDEADDFLHPHEALAARSARPSAIARLARVRGRIEAARRDDVAAGEAFLSALAETEGAQLPFERALVRLAYGQCLRRRGKRRAAATQLTAAKQTFTELGARPSLDRCEAELLASGASRARRRDVPGEELTPQEVAVAGLVTSGKTNREVASALFVSIKTVEVHLTRIYAKLGISSRVQLVVLARSHQQLRPAG